MLFKQTQIDMINGPVLKKIILFTVPMILSSILQLFYNAADIIVLGRFSSQDALAAVGTTGALINLILNIFLGLGVGVNVVASQYYGTKNNEGMSRITHTALTVSLIGGILIGIFGFFMSRTFLEMMDTPADIIDYSTLYMKIYFIGVPASMIYNFGSAILRSVGETRRPLYFLAIAGVVNVLLNLFFVIVMHMSIDGVALATIISQFISAGMVVIYLMNINDSYRFFIGKMHIYKTELLKMIRYGLPAGIQGSVFSISNVLIQSSINSFGKIVVAGNTSASNLEGFVYVAMNAFHFTALTFTGQNVGAGKIERLKRISVTCLILVTIVGLFTGIGVVVLGKPLLSIYLPEDPEALEYGIQRLQVICASYFLCGIMDTLVGVLRGMGASVIPMIISLLGACGFRVVWIYTVFAQNHTLFTLYSSYPISWIITAAAQFILMIAVRRKLMKAHEKHLPLTANR